MSVKFQPKGDKVLVRRFAVVTKVGSLHIPDVAHDKALRGTALALGPAVLDLSLNDEVTFGKYCGTEMAPLGPEFADCILLAEGEVYGVLGGEEGVELEIPAPAVDEEA